MFLSEYDGILKDWLMSYKESGDVELAKCFLYPFLSLVKAYSWGYIFVPVPSSESRIAKRGFRHLNLILESYGFPVSDVLTKANDEEQKKNRAVERRNRGGVNCLDSTRVEGKKVILFDDVMTTGSSFMESADVLMSCHVKKLKGLILMDNYRIDERKLG